MMYLLSWNCGELMPEGTVTLPGGLHIKKNVAIGIGVAAVAVGGFYWYRNRQASSSSTTSQTATQDQGVDPATGYPYGSPEDQAALAASGGYSGQTYGGGYGGYGPQTQPPQTPPQGFQDNAQWTQAAEQLMGSTGNDSIAASLGKYLVAAPLTTDQVTVVQEAIAAEGYPPVAGPNGFPPSYKTVEGPPPPPKQTAKNPVKNLKATARFTQVDVHWEALPNAKDYLVKTYLNGKMIHQDTTPSTFITLHNLQKNTSYRITVWGQPGTGTNASVRVRTEK